MLVVENGKRQVVLVHERRAGAVGHGHDASDRVAGAKLTERGQDPVPRAFGVGVRVGGAGDDPTGARVRFEDASLARR